MKTKHTLKLPKLSKRKKKKKERKRKNIQTPMFERREKNYLPISLRIILRTRTSENYFLPNFPYLNLKPISRFLCSDEKSFFVSELQEDSETLCFVARTHKNETTRK